MSSVTFCILGCNTQPLSNYFDLISCQGNKHIPKNYGARPSRSFDSFLDEIACRKCFSRQSSPRQACSNGTCSARPREELPRHGNCAQSKSPVCPLILSAKRFLQWIRDYSIPCEEQL